MAGTPRKKQKTGKGDRFLENSHSTLHLKRDEAVWDLDIVSWMNKSKGLQGERLMWDTSLVSSFFYFTATCPRDTDSSRDGWCGVFAASAQLQVLCRCFLQAVGPGTVVSQVSSGSGTEQGQSSAAWEVKVQHSISTFRVSDTQQLPPTAPRRCSTLCMNAGN